MKYQNAKAWGPWLLDAQHLTLTHGGTSYEIDLETLDTCAEVLDTLCQVSAKLWCTREDAGHLLGALDELLDPQENLCSLGIEKKFSASLYLKKALRK